MMHEILEQSRCPSGPLGGALAHAMAATHGEFYDVVTRALGDARCVLEIGCGDGSLVTGLVHAVDYTGIDHSQDMIAAARRAMPGQRFICGDISSTALPACDAAFAVNVLQWLREPVAALAAVRRALKTGGRFVAGTPDYECPRRMQIEGLPLYTKDRLAISFRLAGFVDVEIRAIETQATRYLIAVGVA